MVFIAESVDPALSLAPYYKSNLTTLDFHPGTRGLSAHFDPVVTQPTYMEADDEFDICTTVVDGALFVAGYRNHSDCKKKFINKLVSKVNNSQAIIDFSPDKIVVCGDFNMPRTEIDPAFNSVGLFRLGGPPHIFNKHCINRPTYIDHVYSNNISSVTLKFYE